MKKIKGLMFLILLILMVGAVSATEDVNDTMSVPDDNMELESNVSDTLSVEEDDSLGDDATEDISEPQITVKTTTGTAGKTINLKATVKTKNGTAKKATVTFKINGNTYTRTTDANGVASVSVKCPASKAVKTTSKTKKNILTKTTTYKNKSEGCRWSIRL